MPLTQKQMEYLALAWQCFETEPKIDYEKFKTVAGLASAASARELMRVTKNKLKDEYGALSGGMKDSNAATATPKGKKGAGTAAGSTPAKTPAVTARGKKRATPGSGSGGKGMKAKAEVVKGSGDGDGSEEDNEAATPRPAKKIKAEPMEDDDRGSEADADGEVDEDVGVFQL